MSWGKFIGTVGLFGAYIYYTMNGRFFGACFFIFGTNFLAQKGAAAP